MLYLYIARNEERDITKTFPQKDTTAGSSHQKHVKQSVICSQQYFLSTIVCNAATPEQDVIKRTQPAVVVRDLV